MAFNDALFQLGMDLTRSSTAQKEDLGEVAHAVNAALGRTADDRESDRFFGTSHAMDTHVTIDVYGITSLDDLGHVEAALRRCVDAAGSVLEHMHLHPVPAVGGISGVAVLGDGHISFHTRPNAGYAVLDIATSAGCETQRWVAAAKAAFGKCQIVSRVHNRVTETARGANDGGILAAVLPQRRTRLPARNIRVKAA